MIQDGQNGGEGKQCLQCGEAGHVYSECPDFVSLLCGLFGVANIMGPLPKHNQEPTNG